jgi:hypothetical protein
LFSRLAGNVQNIRILNEGVIKPHKVQHWSGKSPDREFEKKHAAITYYWTLYGSSGKRPSGNSGLEISDTGIEQGSNRASFIAHSALAVSAALGVERGGVDHERHCRKGRWYVPRYKATVVRESAATDRRDALKGILLYA